MQTTMDQLVDEFNQTVGRAGDLSQHYLHLRDSATIREKLTMIADDDPGALQCRTSPPAIPRRPHWQQGPLALWMPTSSRELDLYALAFWMRRLGDQLFVFPFAKSTEVLFVNQTFSMNFLPPPLVEDLTTFEGIASRSQYYQWTDEQTPEPGWKALLHCRLTVQYRPGRHAPAGRRSHHRRMLGPDSQEFRTFGPASMSRQSKAAMPFMMVILQIFPRPGNRLLNRFNWRASLLWH